MKLNIATGKSRFDKKWQNKTVSWETLVTKLQDTHYTHETQLEYKRMSKAQQDEVKDIGGFVAGHLKDGKRRKSNVLNRSILTLDADFAKKDLWDVVDMIMDYKALIYSTHSHEPQKPRLRLIIPLDREVSSEEYEAIARKTADELGMDQFDDTTYQASRLMYWPSTSKDAEYVFKVKEGNYLSADKVLAKYTDWTDVSFWPLSSREREIRVSIADKQEHPYDKDNLIGQFCRVYSIVEAIETFIPEVYVPTNGQDDRYSYTGGSTSGGLVIYQNVFAYSNHATDIAGGLLCNAFDLVRLHKFGDLDNDAKENTPINRLPSFVAMSDLANDDIEVKKLRFNESVSDFDDIEPVEVVKIDEAVEETDDWIQKLEYKKSGGLTSSINNFYLIIKNHKVLKGRIKYNQFTNAITVVERLPWDQFYHGHRSWTDNDESNLRHFMETRFQVDGAQKQRDAVNNVANELGFHPVRDYLDELKWDGIERLDTLFIDYLGAEDNEYTRAVTRKSITAAVTRIYHPGIKFDYMLTLTGGQGIGKSTIIRKLAKDFVNDSLTDVRGKDAIEALQGSWYIEMAELTAARKADVESTKQFISKQVDKVRLAYRRNSEELPRQCIFMGTTNDIDFLRDATGNRRFWPLEVSKGVKSVFDLTEEDIDQINAEAKFRYQQGEKLFLENELEQMAMDVQSRHTIEDPWEGIIRDYLELPVPPEWDDFTKNEKNNYFLNEMYSDGEGVQRETTCALAIWHEALGMRQDASTPDIRRIKALMRNNPSWEEAYFMYKGYGRQYGFRRKQLSLKELL